MFNYNSSTQIIIMAMLGGVNNTVGVIIGALLVDVLPEIFRSLQNYMQLIWGFAIIVLMIFMPSGLGGLYETIQSKLRRRKKLQARAEQEVEG